MCDTKMCSKCKTIKALTEFYKATRAKDGRSSQCKVCERPAKRTAARLARQRNPDKVREITQQSVRRWESRHPEQSREIRAQVARAHRIQLSAPYVKGLLKQQGLAGSAADAFLDLKREQLIIKRMACELKRAAKQKAGKDL